VCTKQVKVRGIVRSISALGSRTQKSL